MNADDKGFIFTIDAFLALIPVFILLMAISSMNQGGLILPSQQVRLSNQAQDALDVMAQYHISESTLIEEMVRMLEVNGTGTSGVDSAGELASVYLKDNLPGMNYELVEMNQLNGKTITSNGTRDNALNMAVGTKNYGNFCFKLYVWD